MSRILSARSIHEAAVPYHQTAGYSRQTSPGEDPVHRFFLPLGSSKRVAPVFHRRREFPFPLQLLIVRHAIIGLAMTKASIRSSTLLQSDKHVIRQLNLGLARWHSRIGLKDTSDSASGFRSTFSINSDPIHPAPIMPKRTLLVTIHCSHSVTLFVRPDTPTFGHQTQPGVFLGQLVRLSQRRMPKYLAGLRAASCKAV